MIAIQNATCCQTCAMEDVWYENKKMREAGIEVKGFTFFHEQDTESALTQHHLFLAFGSLKKETEEVLKIGHEIEKCLIAHGLDVQRNGETNQRIKLNVVWQKKWKKNTKQ